VTKLSLLNFREVKTGYKLRHMKRITAV